MLIELYIDKRLQSINLVHLSHTLHVRLGEYPVDCVPRESRQMLSCVGREVRERVKYRFTMHNDPVFRNIIVNGRESRSLS